MAFRIIRKLQQLLDVDPTGLADGEVPTYATVVSKFTMAPPGAAQGHSVTLSGNTAGALALISTGTWTLAGGNGITLSQAGNAVTISGGAGGGTQTAISGISASDTLYTSGTVRFTGVGGGITVSSNTGQRIDLSVAAPVAQSVQTQNLIDLTLAGNTAGALALASSGTVTLAGGNNVTLSQAGNAVTISAANQSVQPETQTFIAGVSASDTLYTSGNVRLTGVGGGVTVSSNTGQRVDISVAAQTVQTQNVVDLTLSGNTAGALALISSGTMTLAGGNNITVSQAGNAVTISGPNVGGAQTGISGISASDTLYTSGTVRLTGVGGGVTISSNTGQRIDISVAAQSVQPETQTFIAGVSASDTLYTSGNVRITGVGGGITVSSNTGQRIDLSVAAPVAQTAQTGISGIANSQTTYTSGTVSLSELGAITIRSTTGNQYQLSVNAQTTQTQGILSMGVSTGGNTLGNTQVSTGSRVVIVASGALTASQATAAGASTITLSAAAQSVQPETQTFIAGVSASDTLYTSGNVRITGVGGGITVSSNTGQRIDLSVAAPVAQTNQTGTIYAASNTTGTSSGTYDARTLSIAGDGIISVAASNSGWRISATQSVQTQDVLSIGVSTGGNTAGNTTVNTGSRLVFVGSNGITVSQGTAAGATTITLSGVTQTVQTQNVHNVTLSGNTAGVMAQISSGTLTLAGGNAITLSQNGNAVTISGAAAAGQFSAGASTGGNTAGATGITGTQLVLVGSDNITLSQTTGANGGTVSFLGKPSFSGGVSNLGNTAGDTGVTGTRVVFVGTDGISLSQATDANGATITFDAPVPVTLTSYNRKPFQLGTGQQGQGTLAMQPYECPNIAFDRIVFPLNYSQATNSTLTASVSMWFGLYTKNASSLSLLLSASTSRSINGSGTASSVSNVGGRLFTMGLTNTITEGNYYVGVISRTSTSSANASISQYLISAPIVSPFSPWATATNATDQLTLGLGHYSATTSAMPASIAFSEIIGSATGAARPVALYFHSGTV